MNEVMNLTEMNWFHRPQLSVVNEKKLILETEPFTEMTAFDGGEHTAFGILSAPYSEFRLATKMEYRFKIRGDECGVVIRMDDAHWIRYGVVLRDDEMSEIFCTFYNGDTVDRCVREISCGIIQLYLHAEYTPGKIVLSYSMNEYRYSAFREMSIVSYPEACVGFYAGSAGDSSFDVTFSHTEVKQI